LNKKLPKRFLIIGYGTIGKAALPILIKEFKLSAEHIHIISADATHTELTQKMGIHITQLALDQTNYQEVITPKLAEGDILLNLAVNVSSLDLIRLCQSVGALYIDTCIEPWKDHYTNEKLSISDRSNYALREQAIALKTEYTNGTTAVVAHGANPGLVSHFIKQALLNLSQNILPQNDEVSIEVPTTKQAWAELAQKLCIKSIHIAEFDWQKTHMKRQPGDFFSTWSAEGFISEGLQPAELGWGSHEKQLPADGKQHEHGCKSAIYINKPSFSTRIRSWTPMAGPFQAYLVTHNESISIADYLTIKSNEHVTYRPTVLYAYHPSSEAVLSVHEMEGRNFSMPINKRVLVDEVDGIDELGVLLMGHNQVTYWYGSHLSTQETKTIAPYNNATSCQVIAGLIGAIHWAIDNPNAGIVEAEDLDFDFVLEKAKPYMGPVDGFYSKWTPIANRTQLFEEDLDFACPWQFKNFRVA
jgi:homospermidine synthase